MNNRIIHPNRDLTAGEQDLTTEELADINKLLKQADAKQTPKITKSYKKNAANETAPIVSKKTKSERSGTQIDQEDNIIHLADCSLIKFGEIYYVIEEKLGKGTFGKVKKLPKYYFIKDENGNYQRRAFSTDTPATVDIPVVKIISMEPFLDWNDFKKSIQREFDNLKDVKKDKYAALVIDEVRQKAYIRMTFAHGDTLEKYFDTHKNISFKKRLKVIDSTIQVMLNLHQSNRIHLDFKPDNLMYDEKTGTSSLLDWDAVVPPDFQDDRNDVPSAPLFAHQHSLIASEANALAGVIGVALTVRNFEPDKYWFAPIFKIKVFEGTNAPLYPYNFEALLQAPCTALGDRAQEEYLFAIIDKLKTLDPNDKKNFPTNFTSEAYDKILSELQAVIREALLNIPDETHELKSAKRNLTAQIDNDSIHSITQIINKMHQLRSEIFACIINNSPTEIHDQITMDQIESSSRYYQLKSDLAEMRNTENSDDMTNKMSEAMDNIESYIFDLNQAFSKFDTLNIDEQIHFDDLMKNWRKLENQLDVIFKNLESKPQIPEEIVTIKTPIITPIDKSGLPIEEVMISTPISTPKPQTSTRTTDIKKDSYAELLKKVALNILDHPFELHGKKTGKTINLSDYGNITLIYITDEKKRISHGAYNVLNIVQQYLKNTTQLTEQDMKKAAQEIYEALKGKDETTLGFFCHGKRDQSTVNLYKDILKELQEYYNKTPDGPAHFRPRM